MAGDNVSIPFEPALMLLPFLQPNGRAIKYKLFDDPTRVVLVRNTEGRPPRPHRHPVNPEQHKYESDVDVLPSDAYVYDRNPDYAVLSDTTDDEEDDDFDAVHPKDRRIAKKHMKYMLHPQFWHKRGWNKRMRWTNVDPVDVCRIIDVTVPRRSAESIRRQLQARQPVKIHKVRVRPFYRSPALWADADLPNIKDRVRMPELFDNPTAEQREVDTLVDDQCRVVRVPGSLTGVHHRKFVFPPLEVNDQFERRSLVYVDGDWPADDGICVTECSAERPRTWSPALFESSRLCAQCMGIFHTRCLVVGAFAVDLKDPDVVAAIDEKPTLAHLRFLLHKDAEPLPAPPLYDHGFGQEKEPNEDVMDEMGQYPLVDTTFAEVAAMPLRRKCYPGEAPQTLEVVIQWARERASQGEGNTLLTEDALRAELKRLHMEPVFRGAKIILLRYLRLLRLSTHRLFRCPSCGMDSLI